MVNQSPIGTQRGSDGAVDMLSLLATKVTRKSTLCQREELIAQVPSIYVMVYKYGSVVLR